jgi:hypothetical protein
VAPDDPHGGCPEQQGYGDQSGGLDRLELPELTGGPIRQITAAPVRLRVRAPRKAAALRVTAIQPAYTGAYKPNQGSARRSAR